MSRLYLLDTNIVSDLVRHPSGLIAQRIAKVGENRVCTSIVAVCELRFGAVKKGSARLGANLSRVFLV
ncbi:MAG: type II toxin-antitoxin system VapC family toxin, partial [Gammaproteobacteria bacterium]|nr:type II toxin-antitoxin system VapC family toxin [Gammaproteobacteria bacterium]